MHRHRYRHLICHHLIWLNYFYPLLKYTKTIYDIRRLFVILSFHWWSGHMHRDRVVCISRKRNWWQLIRNSKVGSSYLCWFYHIEKWNAKIHNSYSGDKQVECSAGFNSHKHPSPSPGPLGYRKLELMNGKKKKNLVTNICWKLFPFVPYCLSFFKSCVQFLG